MLHLPNGLSIDQLKKYAKRLKKEQNISLIDAQNKIAQEHSDQPTWKEMIKHIKKENILSFQTLDNSHQLFHLKENPILLLTGFSGTGKTTILKTLVNNYLTNHNSNVLFVNFFDSAHELEIFEGKGLNHYPCNLKDLTIKKPNDIKYIFNSIQESINDNIGLVVIDELSKVQFNNDSINYFLKLLIKCKKNKIPVVLSLQALNDILYSNISSFISHYLFLGNDLSLSLFENDLLFIEFETQTNKDGIEGILSFKPFLNEYKKISFKNN